MRSAALLLLLSLICPAPPTARDAPIDRVEEDWELVITEPDVPAAGPQITTTMTPSSTSTSPVVNFNLNYRDRPNFQAGGLQVQVWQGGEVLAMATDHDAPLSTAGETITWTQRMTLSGASIEYEVRSGNSTTWGDFGGEDLELSFTSNLDDLSGYSSATSQSKSGIGWQSNHVTSMKLLRVRYYAGEDLVATEENPRIVHPVVCP